MISTVSLLALLAAGPASAASLDAEHFTLGIPFEANLVGLAFGAQPELLWRPFSPEGRFHVRAATGVVAGPELALVPVSLGTRGVFFPTSKVRPGMGLGLKMQTFLPYGHEAILRLDQYFELTLDVKVQDNLRVGVELSPEFGWIGGFGLGMAARVGVLMDLPLSR